MRSYLFGLAAACFAISPLAGSTIQAQEAESALNRSRLLPPLPKREPGSPPPIVTAPAAPPIQIVPRAPAPEVPKFASPSQLAEMVEACMEVVKPDFEVDATTLAKNGWGYTQPTRGQMAEGAYEKVMYFKGGLAIALFDFGPVVTCRGIATIEDSAQFREVRSGIIDKLHAAPLRAVPGLTNFSNLVSKHKPQIDQENILILGSYQIELSSTTITAAQHRQVGIPDLVMVMATTTPLAPQFRDYVKSAEVE